MTEQKVVEWSENMNSNIEVINHPDRKEMKTFLESCGADFREIEKVEGSMKKWTNQGNAEAMKAIWGEEKWKDFKNWARNYAKQYEATTHERQGRIKGLPGFGPIRLLCLMTRYAAFDDSTDKRFKHGRFVIDLGVRRLNGELRAEGIDPEEFQKLTRPDTHEVYRPSSFPPGYPEALVNEMKTWNR